MVSITIDVVPVNVVTLFAGRVAVNEFEKTAIFEEAAIFFVFVVVYGLTEFAVRLFSVKLAVCEFVFEFITTIAKSPVAGSL